jgi:hypothetical protein
MKVSTRVAAAMAATTTLVGAGAQFGAQAAHAVVRPDINRVSCSKSGDWLVVYQSDSTHADCFANAGAEDVKIYNLDSVYTGNNGVYCVVGGVGFGDPYKNTLFFTSDPPYVYYNSGTMTYLSIYPGTADSATAAHPVVTKVHPG